MTRHGGQAAVRLELRPPRRTPYKIRVYSCPFVVLSRPSPESWEGSFWKKLHLAVNLLVYSLLHEADIGSVLPSRILDLGPLDFSPMPPGVCLSHSDVAKPGSAIPGYGAGEASALRTAVRNSSSSKGLVKR